jgi:hypothetical protein
MLFELLDAAAEDERERKLAYRTELAGALRTYYAREFTGSLAVFSDLRRHNPGDPVLRIYEKRARLLSELGAPEGWDGVEMLEMK